MFSRRRIWRSVRVPHLLLFPALLAFLLVLTGCGGGTRPSGKAEADKKPVSSVELDKEIDYQAALQAMTDERYKEALEAFRALGEYEDSAVLYTECCERYKATTYDEAMQLIKVDRYSEALLKLTEIETMDANYKGVSSLAVYCNKQGVLREIEVALDNGNYNQALDLMLLVPDCKERADLYCRLRELAAFDGAEAAELSHNDLTYREHYPEGSLWILQGYYSRVSSGLFSNDYYLEISSSAIFTDIRCYGISENQLKNAKEGEYYIIAGYYSSTDFYFNFTNCQILSQTTGKKLDGVFQSEHSLSEATGAEKHLREYAENALTDTLENTESPAVVAPSSPAPTPSQNQTPSSENDEGAAVFEVPYFSVELPSEWKGKIIVDVDQVSQSITFTERQNYDAENGGFLATIGVYIPEDAFELLENNYFPIEYYTLGYIITKDGDNYYLLEETILPNRSRVWGDETLDEAYLLAGECLQAVYASIKGINGCTYEPSETGAAPTPVGQTAPDSRQAIVIGVSEYNGQYYSSLSLEEWNGSDWETVYYDIPAAIGSNGTTASKREGDHCTPSGTFNILFCFSDQALETNLRQKYITEGDVWVTDQSSRYYNTIQPDSAGYKDWSKSENIYRQFTSGKSYAGILFDYNGDGESADSATPGAGAALFLDGIGSSGDLYTGYGDIKISESDMKRLLKVLDQSLNPTIIIRATD